MVLNLPGSCPKLLLGWSARAHQRPVAQQSILDAVDVSQLQAQGLTEAALMLVLSGRG